MTGAESDEEFFRRLSHEFAAGRWNAIFQELHKPYRDFVSGPVFRDRLVQLNEAYSAVPAPLGTSEGDVATLRLAMAHTHANAEAVLVAVAAYLSRHEPTASS